MTNHGVTLLELALVLTLLGIVGGILAPRLASWPDRIAVEGTAATTRDLLDQARTAAIRLARPVGVLDSAGALRVVTDVDTAAVTLRALPIATGIRLTGLDRRVSFGAHGLATGLANRTIRIQQGAVVRDIVISRLGRIR